VASDLEAYTNGMVHLDKEKFQKVYDFYEKNQGGRYNVPTGIIPRRIKGKISKCI
jgi:hypothetical protein